ncbi:MAG: hypothetical protein U9O89_06110 [Thermoproteota archaeon]|nr:hypothetical protein [Thermoproteota archaeon]
MTTEIVQIHKPPQSSQNNAAREKPSSVDLSLVQAGTVYEKLYNLEPHAKPEKPLKIDLNLYQLER